MTKIKKKAANPKHGDIMCHYDDIVAIAELKPHPRNPNRHSPEQLENYRQIMRENGVRTCVRVSKRSGYMTKGHGQVLAAQLEGWTHVPVEYQKYKNEELEFADLVADNALARQAELDLAIVNVAIQDLGPELNLELLALPGFEVEPADKNAGLTDQDDVPEPPKKPKTKRGDIYLMGNHRLLCGDSTSDKDVSKLMVDDFADLVFTDPPYGVSYDGGHAVAGVRRQKLANDNSTLIYDDSVPMMFKYSKTNAALYLWFAATKSLQVLQVLQANGYEIRSWLIWNKNMAQFGAIGAQYKQKHEPCLYAYKKGHSPFWDGPNNEVSVWDVARASKNEFHPTQKPVDLSKRAIGNSCPKNGIVLDLFGGSGSTLIGAEMLGRSARLMELDETYCDIIVSRWEAFTGDKAKVLKSQS